MVKLGWALGIAWVLAGPVIAQVAGVAAFTPQGTVQGVRQVVARFTAPMVGFGNPQLAAPFNLSCAPPGSGRWADSNTYIYDFASDLPGGVACTFTLKAGITTLAGKPLGGPRTFTFNTGGPTVSHSQPYDGHTRIDEHQVFILRLDAAPEVAALHAMTHCEVADIKERIGVTWLTAEERLALLTALTTDQTTDLQKLSADPARPQSAVELANDAQVLALRCQRTLPPDTDVRLVLRAGLRTPNGLATDQDQALSFRTRPAFVVRMECERVHRGAACLPIRPITVRFSAPVPVALAQQIRLTGPDSQTYSPQPTDASRAAAVLEELRFPGPFPVAATLRLSLPEELRDDAGRVAENAPRFPLEFNTDALPPLVKFPAIFGILERTEGGLLPVTLRNVEPELAGQQASPPVHGTSLRVEQADADIISWLKRVDAHNQADGVWLEGANQRPVWHERTGSESVFSSAFDILAETTSSSPPPKLPADTVTRPFTVPKPLGGKDFEVIAIRLQDPGFYVVELASPMLGQALLGELRPRYVSTAALVTNLSVHFKWGREHSLVWVTTLDRGTPVADALVHVSDFCTGQTLWQGATGADGTAIIASGLPAPHGADNCWWRAPLFVSARKDDDLGFVTSFWNRGIQPSDFRLTEASAADDVAAHTVFDRTLLKAGETVSMKHFLRRKTGTGFAVEVGAAARTLRLVHVGSGQEYTQSVSFDASGIAESRFAIPPDAKLGEYRVLLDGDRHTLQTGSLRVEQFRLPTLRATLQGPTAVQIKPSEVQLDATVDYISGGGAGGLPVKLRSVVEPREVQFADYANFQFGDAPLQLGEQAETTVASRSSPAQLSTLQLDPHGALRTQVGKLAPITAPASLVAELEYPDANGELLAMHQRIPLWPSELLVGLASDGWVAQQDKVALKAVVVNTAGHPQTRRKVSVQLYKRTTISYRKRLIGGFYAYQNDVKVEAIGERCDGITDALGYLSCELHPSVSGELIAEAQTADDAGNAAYANRAVWVAGEDDWWFAGQASDRIDLLPEQAEYQPGETMRLQARMPFRHATALITVEREGVLDHRVVTLSGKQPVVEVPVRGSYAPNVYVSALVLRGRAQPGFLQQLGAKLGLTASPAETITTRIDLARPAYRLGLADVRVGQQAHRLDVRVRADKSVYPVRGQAHIEVQVQPADGAPLPAPAELAVAAVDEALLELQDNRSWDLLGAMMGKRGIEVYTATAQMQVTGKRHYGRKAVAPGGGGGRQAARELFDTLLLWRGRVPLDARGHAAFTIPLNDSLSTFRVMAVAHAGPDRFGSGATQIRTHQDLMLVSGLPPVVRKGDRFRATITVRNASAQPLQPEVRAQVHDTSDPAQTMTLPPQTVPLAAGEARDMGWEVDVPSGAEGWQWDVYAASGTQAQDLLRVTQQILPAVPVRVYQAVLEQLAPELTLAVQRPAAALPGRGGLQVNVQPQLVQGLTGVRQYFAGYPYRCLEQQLSKAVALRDRAAWDAVMTTLPAYLDHDGLAKYFASSWLEGSDVLTSYLLAISQTSGWTLPDAERKRMLAGLVAFAVGKIHPSTAVAAADLTVRKLMAIDALSRYDAATPAMLDSLTIDPNRWPTSAVLDWIGILRRVEGLPRASQRLATAIQILHSRLTYQSTALSFSTEDQDGLWWLMVSPDVNAARTLLAATELPELRADAGRIARGAVRRMRRGHWDLTTANAWGVVAMERFSQTFEREPVSGHTTSTLGQQTTTVDWSTSAAPTAIDFPWPSGPAELRMHHQGSGKPWATIQSLAAIPLRRPVSTGFTIRRSVTPVEQQHVGRWSRGDVIKVKLQLESQSDMSWVVVDDPLPAGASLLGTGLGGDSALLTPQRDTPDCKYWAKFYCLVLLTGDHDYWLRPAYEERRFDAYRAYYEFVPKGHWSVEYTLRLNNPGTFQLPESRVEAMYAPEMWGALPLDAVVVQP